MHSTPSKQFYLLEPGNPIIEERRPAIEATLTAEVRKLAITVAPEVVDLHDVQLPQEVVLALQHYPQHIEKMLGTFHFDFEMREDSKLYIPEADWKKQGKYKRWFHEMNALAFIGFFAQDKDVRLYMLDGDYLAKSKMPVPKRDAGNGRFKYEIMGGARLQLSKRLANCCKQFMLYCHGSGFDPKPYIVDMLADYTLPVHYIDIYKEYRKDVEHRLKANVVEV